jgi:hypothetical protein
VTLEGQVTYEAYTSGVIAIEICESESSSYAGGGTVMLKTPGDCVKELVIEAPGPFSAEATVHWADEEPMIQLLAYLLEEEDTDLWSCDAGAFLTLSLADHDDIVLPLVAAECPMRE